MSWISTVFSGGVDKIVDSVAKGIDSTFTSDHERLEARNMLAKIKADAKHKDKEIEIQYEVEITKRNESDQVHGNFLTKSARPIFLYWIMAIITILIFGGMYGYNVKDGYIDLITALSITAVTFFFGSKGFEQWKHGRQI